MKKFIIFYLFLLLLSAATYAEQTNRIVLTDGSVINGQIVSFSNGVYTIKSAAFGELKVDGTKVSKIESVNAPSLDMPTDSSGETKNLSKSQIDNYTQALMSNPENASIIMGLAADPQIQELAKDPQIIEAAKTGNLEALMKNEKFMNAIKNSKVKDAATKIKQ